MYNTIPKYSISTKRHKGNVCELQHDHTLSFGKMRSQCVKIRNRGDNNNNKNFKKPQKKKPVYVEPVQTHTLRPGSEPVTEVKLRLSKKEARL